MLETLKRTNLTNNRYWSPCSEKLLRKDFQITSHYKGSYGDGTVCRVNKIKH